MTREEYIEELKARIAHLPLEERDAALSYYIEYLQDADDKTMEEIISELGTPKEVAERIIAECAQAKNKEGETSKGCLIGVLIGITSPLWFPLSIAAAAVIFSLLLTAVILLAVFGILAVVLFGLGLWALFVDAATGIAVLGGGCLLAGISILLILFFSAMGSLMKNLIAMIRGRRKSE